MLFAVKILQCARLEQLTIPKPLDSSIFWNVTEVLAKDFLANMYSNNIY